MASAESPFVALSVERLLGTLRARDLLHELQRSLGSGAGTASARVLPPYDAAGVGQTVSDIHALHAALVETTAAAAAAAAASAARAPRTNNGSDDDDDDDDDDESRAAVRMAAMVQRAAIEHERACVLAYLRTRLAEIERLRWELSSATLPAAVAAGTTTASSGGAGSSTAPPRLSELERSYYTAYSRLLSRFMARIAGPPAHTETQGSEQEGGGAEDEEDETEEEDDDEGALEDALLDINGDLLGFPPRPVQTAAATGAGAGGGRGGAGAALSDGLFVQVRGTGDPAAREEVLTRDGAISLARDAVQWVRLDSTVHALLKQGRLVHYQ